MDAIILKDKPTDDKCKNCSLIYMHNGIIHNGIRHVLVDNAVGKMGWYSCSMRKQCSNAGIGLDICVNIFGTDKCHFEIK